MFALSVKISDWLLEDIDQEALAVSNYSASSNSGVSTLATDDYQNSSGYPNSYSKSGGYEATGYSKYIESLYSDSAVLEDPTFTTSKTTSSVTIKVVDAGDYSYFSYSLRDANDNIISAATSYSTTTTKTYTGLDPSTGYIIVVSWSTSTTGMGNYDYYPVTTDSLSVEYWSWTSSNGSATAAQTEAAYDAITGNGITSDFSYKVWNDMVEKVVDIWHAQGGYWDTTKLSYDQTLMTASDRVLTAARFNSLRYNIGLNVSTGITDKSPGDVVRGSYFITLANCLNDWIDTL